MKIKIGYYYIIHLSIGIDKAYFKNKCNYNNDYIIGKVVEKHGDIAYLVQIPKLKGKLHDGYERFGFKYLDNDVWYFIKEDILEKTKRPKEEDLHMELFKYVI